MLVGFLHLEFLFVSPFFHYRYTGAVLQRHPSAVDDHYHGRPTTSFIAREPSLSFTLYSPKTWEPRLTDLACVSSSHLVHSSIGSSPSLAVLLRHRTFILATHRLLQPKRHHRYREKLPQRTILVLFSSRWVFSSG